MRTAICISGLPRTFKQALPSMKEHLIDPLNADVFISTWDCTDTINKGSTLSQKDDGSLEEFRKYYNALDFEAEEHNKDTVHKVFPFPKESSKIWKISAIPMFYKMYRANRLRKEWERTHNFKYDLVIRARSDMVYNNGIEPKDIQESLDNENILHLIIENGIWDQFAFSSGPAMDIYSDMFYNIRESITELEKLGTPRIAAELMLDCYLNKTSLILRHTNITYDFIRDFGLRLIHTNK